MNECPEYSTVILVHAAWACPAAISPPWRNIPEFLELWSHSSHLCARRRSRPKLVSVGYPSQIRQCLVEILCLLTTHRADAKQLIRVAHTGIEQSTLARLLR